MVKDLSLKGYKIATLCALLELSRSGYYAWLKRPISNRAIKHKTLLNNVRDIHFKSRGTYGVPRVLETLKSNGHHHGKNKVAKVMKEAGLSGAATKRFKIQTTNSNHEYRPFERLLKTEEKSTFPGRANRIWVSDITYIWTEEGWLYLAIFLDVFTRKVVGFAMQDHLRTELVLEALEMAMGRQSCNFDSLISHSDRGIQYACEDYRERLSDLGIKISHSRKGNCYDNAFAESFFHTLKVELIHRNNYKTQKEARESIFEFIEVWYNRERLHSSLGYKTPLSYEKDTLTA